MPFTFAHPALILPFLRLPARYISTTALVIGAIVPDMEYFLRLKVRSDISHAPLGIILFDIPLGLLTWLLCRLVVLPGLARNLPFSLKKPVSLQTAALIDTEKRINALTLLTCLVVGIATHLVWDSFTHETGFAVRQISMLSSFYQASGFTVPGYKIAQHVSTLAGFIFLIIFLRKIFVYNPSKKLSARYLVVIAATATTVLVVKLLLSGGATLGDLIVTAIAGLLAGLIVSPLLVNRSR